MEETLQQEKKDLEYQNPNDDQGTVSSFEVES